MTSPNNITRFPLAPVPPAHLQVQKLRSKKRNKPVTASPSADDCSTTQKSNLSNVVLDASLYPLPLSPGSSSNIPYQRYEKSHYKSSADESLDFLPRPLKIKKREASLHRNSPSDTLKPNDSTIFTLDGPTDPTLQIRALFGVPSKKVSSQKRIVSSPSKMQASFLDKLNMFSRHFSKTLAPKSSRPKEKPHAVISHHNLIGGVDGTDSRPGSLYANSAGLNHSLYSRYDDDDDSDLGSGEPLYAEGDHGSMSQFSFITSSGQQNRRSNLVSSIFNPASSMLGAPVKRSASTSAADYQRKANYPGKFKLGKLKNKDKKMKRAAPLLTDGGSSTASGSSGIFGISGAKKSISKLIDNVVHPSSDKKSGKLGVTSENYTLPSSMPLEPIDEQKSSSRQFDPGDSQSSHISTGATSTPYVTTPYVRSEVAMQNNVTQRKPPFAYIDLSVVSDVKAADITTEQESWAVVEVRGKARVSDRTTITQGLEIILLLDLSAHTSPSTFTSLINTVQSIMSRLSDRDDDVISMAGFNNGLQLLLSSEAATESAKESIAIILRDLQEERRGEIHTNMADHDIVRYLQGSLTYFSEDPFNLQNPRSRHVILLTSNFGERDAYTALSMSGYEDVHIHVLGLGCLYWPSATALSKTIPSGGWNFPTSPMDVSIPNYMQMRPAREIKNFIRCLRHPTELGELKDVNICITPGEHTAVKAIIGNTSFKVLRPGERTTILLRIKLFQGESHSPESDPLPAPPSSPDVEDLERELRATLGDLKMPLVTIHAFYNHSLLPRSTYLSTAAEAEVTRYRKGSIWASTEPDLISPQISKVTSSSYTHNDYVRKALMQKVVSEHRNPRRALAAVEDIASSTDAKNMDYLDLVRELRYQVALSDSKRSGKRSRVANKEIAAMRAASNEPSVAGSYGLHHTPSVTEGSPTPQPPDPDDTIPNVSQILSGSAESGDLQFKDSPKIPRKVRSVDTAGRLWEELEGQHISEHMQGTDSPGSLNTLRDVTEVEFSPWAI